MELLIADDQCIADLMPDDQEDDLVAVDILQHPEVAHAQLEPGQGIGTEFLDRPGHRRGLIRELRRDRRLQYPLIPAGWHGHVFVRRHQDWPLDATGVWPR
jgi:hypothetical protein